MSHPDPQQAYAQGYHVGYQHGVEAATSGTNPGGSNYPVNLVATYPERSSRALMFFLFFKPLLLLPHLIVFWFLAIAVSLVAFFAWFAVVFTGQYPKPLWNFMLGVQRWQARMNAWILGLVDRYPPFSLD